MASGINGTHGRIEYKELHAPKRSPFPESEIATDITYIPIFGGREKINVINLGGGGHGGADLLLCDELFIGNNISATVQCHADLNDGIEAILTGVSVFKSIIQGKPIDLRPLREEVFG